MKKFLAFCLALLVGVGVLVPAMGAYASATVYVTAPHVTSDAITVTLPDGTKALKYDITISDVMALHADSVTGCTVVQFYLLFDTEKLELIGDRMSMEDGSSIYYETTSAFGTKRSDAQPMSNCDFVCTTSDSEYGYLSGYAFLHATAQACWFEDGLVTSLYFTLKDDVADGTVLPMEFCAIEVAETGLQGKPLLCQFDTYDPKDAVGEVLDSVSFGYHDGSITVGDGSMPQPTLPPCLQNGHSYGAETVTLASTCHTFGMKSKTCTVCGEVLETVLPLDAQNHTALRADREKSVVVTCTTDGISAFTCKDCGASFTEKTAALGHKWYRKAEESVYRCQQCDETMEVQQLRTYTVTFLADGQSVETVSVTEGETLHKIPAVPQRDGMVGVWDKTFAGVLMQGDLTVTAQYGLTGDVDGDGAVLANDLAILLRAADNTASLAPLPFAQCDRNGDGRIDRMDADILLAILTKSV